MSVRDGRQHALVNGNIPSFCGATDSITSHPHNNLIIVIVDG